MAGGNPDALLGSFAVTGGFQFANGQQTLGTDTADWRADPNATVQDLGGPLSWTAPTDAPTSWGVNGGSNIWDSAIGGPIAGVSASAQWIWSQSDPSGEAFFSTTITDPKVAGVPEPAAWALMIVGFGLTGAALRRRRTPAFARI
ncbi:MAG: PEP-CTERM sorting domain-containing protein [Phenylobacterium sp.]|nr:MAG: PEP-CTERM sorting domain-containing protein [Phenylobacterium sp.]